jgi:hypothetical protein
MLTINWWSLLLTILIGIVLGLVLARMTPVHPTVFLWMHYFLHGFLGATLGYFSFIIFWLIVMFQKYDGPVSDSVRFWSAAYMTEFIVAAVLIIFYRRPILAKLKDIFGQEEDEIGGDDFE